MMFVELHEKLLIREADLLHLQAAVSPFPVTAHVVNTKNEGEY